MDSSRNSDFIIPPESVPQEIRDQFEHPKILEPNKAQLPKEDYIIPEESVPEDIKMALGGLPATSNIVGESDGFLERRAKNIASTTGAMIGGTGEALGLFASWNDQISQASGGDQGLLSRLISKSLRGMGDPLAQAGEDIAQKYAVEDPGFWDKATGALASGATFFLPGLGTAGFIKAVGMAPKMATAFGVSVSTLMESSIEAGFARSEALKRGKSPQEADNIASKVFALNVPITAVGNRFGLFGEAQSIPGKIVKAGLGEAVQEGAQQVAGNIPMGDPALQGVGESMLYGGLAGGVLGGGAEAVQEYAKRAQEQFAGPESGAPQPQPPTIPGQPNLPAGTIIGGPGYAQGTGTEVEAGSQAQAPVQEAGAGVRVRDDAQAGVVPEGGAFPVVEPEAPKASGIRSKIMAIAGGAVKGMGQYRDEYIKRDANGWGHYATLDPDYAKAFNQQAIDAIVRQPNGAKILQQKKKNKELPMFNVVNFKPEVDELINANLPFNQQSPYVQKAIRASKIPMWLEQAGQIDLLEDGTTEWSIIRNALEDIAGEAEHSEDVKIKRSRKDIQRFGMFNSKAEGPHYRPAKAVSQYLDSIGIPGQLYFSYDDKDNLKTNIVGFSGKYMQILKQLAYNSDEIYDQKYGGEGIGERAKGATIPSVAFSVDKVGGKIVVRRGKSPASFQVEPVEQMRLRKLQREENLAKFKGATPKEWSERPLYHGTMSEKMYNVFKPNHKGLIFLSPDYEFAGGYAGFSTAGYAGEADIPMDLRKEVIAQYQGSRMYEVWARAENPFDPMADGLAPNVEKWIRENWAKEGGIFEDIANEMSVDGSPNDHFLSYFGGLTEEQALNVYLDGLRSGDWPMLEASPQFLKHLQSVGYDAVVVEEAGRRNLAVFSREQIKSATGNVGSYDRTNPDIRKKSASPARLKPGTIRAYFEVAPDPNNKHITERWNKLSDADKYAASTSVANQIVPKVLKTFNVGGNVEKHIGGYMGNTNPSLAITLESGATPEQLINVARMAGYSLHQDSVMLVSDAPFSGGTETGVIMLDVSGMSEQQIRDLYSSLYEIEVNGQKIATGHTTVNGTMAIANFDKVVPDEEFARLVADKSGKTVKIGSAYTSFISKGEYGYARYTETKEPAPGKPFRGKANILRKQAASAIKQWIFGKPAPDAGSEIRAKSAQPPAAGGPPQKPVKGEETSTNINPLERIEKGFSTSKSAEAIENSLMLYHVVQLAEKLGIHIPKIVEAFKSSTTLGTTNPKGRIKIIYTLFKDIEANDFKGMKNKRAIMVLLHEIMHVVDAVDKLPNDGSKIEGLDWKPGNPLYHLMNVRKGGFKFIKDRMVTPEAMTEDMKFAEESFAKSLETSADQLKLQGKDRADYIKERRAKEHDEYMVFQGFIPERMLVEELHRFYNWFNDKHTPISEFTNSKTKQVMIDEAVADFMTGLILTPEKVKEFAPTYASLFQQWILNKPEFKQAMQDFYMGLGFKPEEILKPEHPLNRLINKTIEGFNASSKKLAEHQATKDKVREARRKHALSLSAFDRLWPIKNLLRDATFNGQKGIDYSSELSPLESIERMLMTGNMSEVYLRAIHDKIVKVARKTKRLGDYNLLSLLMMTRRVQKERAELANPGGLEPGSAAQIEEEYLKKVAGDEWGILNQMAKDFHELRVREVLSDRDFAETFGEEATKAFKDNDAYATFTPLQFIDKFGGEGVFGNPIKRQLGTLQDIADPLEQTMLKDLSLLFVMRRSQAVRDLAKFLNQFYPDSIKEAKYMGEQGFSSAPAGFATLKYLDGGSVKAIHVPESIYKVFEGNNGDAYVAVRFLDKWLNSLPKALFVRLRPAFFFFNIIRDPVTTYMNLPKVPVGSGLIEAFLKTVKNLPKAYRDVRGKEYDAMITEMKRQAVLYSMFTESDADTLGIERMLEQRGLRIKDIAEARDLTARGKAVSTVQWLYHWMEDVGLASEIAGKMAGEELIAKYYPGKDRRWINHMIRTRVGTPSTAGAGFLTPFYNFLMLYSHISALGFRGAWGSMKEDPKRYFMKSMLTAIMPKMMYRAALMGMMGDELEKLFKQIPEHDLNGYIIVPRGFDSKGKSVYLRLPLDEMSRLLGGMVFQGSKALDSKDEMEILNAMVGAMDYSLGQAPGPAPWFMIAKQISQMSRGETPTGGLGEAVIPERYMREWGTAEGKARAIGSYTKNMWNYLGGNMLYKFKTDTLKGVRSELEKATGYVGIGDVFGRFVKVTDSGLSQRGFEVRAKGMAESAASRNKVYREVVDFWSDFIDKNDDTPKAGDIAKLYRELKRKYPEDMRGTSVGSFRSQFNHMVYMGYDRRFTGLNIGDNATKGMVLYEYEKDMSEQEFDSFVGQARRMRLIGPGAMMEYRKLKRADEKRTP